MSEATRLFTEVDRLLRQGQTVAVASVVRTRGSTPRRVGTRMLVRADGTALGTIGGGCGEAEVWRVGLEVIADGRPRTVLVDLTQDISMLSEGVCGGILEVLVEPWGPSAGSGATNWVQVADDQPQEIAQSILGGLAAQQPTTLVTLLAAPDGATRGPAKLLVRSDGTAVGDLGSSALQRRVVADGAAMLAGGSAQTLDYDLPEGRASVFFDAVSPRPMLVIVGAGHIAVPLAQIGSLLEFEVVVMDDRPSFADPARFPTADRVIADDLESALDSLPIGPSTYVVLVTRGHTHDVRSLRRMLGRPAGYVGMIGSRRRVFAVFKLLHDEGVAAEELVRIHAPIGLDLDAETPAEIAVSIGAELLKVRRGGRVVSRSDLTRADYLDSLEDGNRGAALAAASLPALGQDGSPVDGEPATPAGKEVSL